MKWEFKYASHLGYISPEEPLFRATVNNPDPWEHVSYAASLGLSGVLYPWAISRPAEEVSRFEAAIKHFGLQAGCLVFSDIATMLTPIWSRAPKDAQRSLLEQMDNIALLANRLGSKLIAVLIKADELVEREIQYENIVENLRAVTVRAAASGLVIGVEPITVLPGMFLRSLADAKQLIQDVGHPALKIIFDTGHVQMTDGDVLSAFKAYGNDIVLIQFADMPNRTEPGSGSIDFVGLLEELARTPHLANQIIDLEHGWINSTPDGEARGLRLLQDIDARAKPLSGTP